MGSELAPATPTPLEMIDVLGEAIATGVIPTRDVLTALGTIRQAVEQSRTARNDFPVGFTSGHRIASYATASDPHKPNTLTAPADRTYAPTDI